MNRKIYFRADAGPNIGYGHFIRTLALADMLKDDFECVFFTQTPTDYQKKEMESICRYVELPADESKFGLFLDYLTGQEIVVLDNYFYSTDYQCEIKAKGCKLVFIDDMHDKHYVADVVINHGATNTYEYDCEPYTRLCLGTDWTLLRRPFMVPIKSEERKSRIIICFGGADPLRLTDKVVSMLLQIGVKQEIVAILGDTAYLNDDIIQKVTIMHNLTAQQMADLFETSSFGIFSTSTVCLEALSRELPMMIGYYVDNQKEGYERFLERGNFIRLNCLPTITVESLKKAIAETEAFIPTKRDFSQIPGNYKKLFYSI